MSELEPYAGLVHSTEQKLRDASDLLRQYEQRHLENVRHITELTSKVGLIGELPCLLRCFLRCLLRCLVTRRTVTTRATLQ